MHSAGKKKNRAIRFKAKNQRAVGAGEKTNSWSKKRVLNKKWGSSLSLITSWAGSPQLETAGH